MIATVIPPGKPISKKQAQACLEKYLENTALLLKAVRMYEGEHGQTALRAFVNPDATAYIFHREEILEFFKHDPQPEYLFVVMGAQTVDEKSSDGTTLNFKKDEPTVILMPCTEQGGEFTTLGIKNAYEEHPTHRLLIKVPLSDNNFVFHVERG